MMCYTDFSQLLPIFTVKKGTAVNVAKMQKV